jgi:hypothetical protein
VTTASKELETVLDVGIPVGAADLIDVSLKLRRIDLGRGPTRSAHEMVVVMFTSAKPIELLAVSMHDVDDTCSLEVLKGGVDGGEADVPPGRAQLTM